MKQLMFSKIRKKFSLVGLAVFAGLWYWHSISSIAHAAVGTLTINQSVSGTITAGDVTSSKFLDSANAAYFLDPNATGDSLVVAGSATTSGNLTVGNTSAVRSAFGPLQLQYKSGLNAWTTGFTLQDTTGNVGIGTTTPLATLDVAGSASASGNLTLRGTGTAHLINLYDNGSLQIGNSVGGGTATPAFVVTTAGQVGIGTTGPGYKLEVVGQTLLDDGGTSGSRSTSMWAGARGLTLESQWSNFARISEGLYSNAGTLKYYTGVGNKVSTINMVDGDLTVSSGTSTGTGNAASLSDLLTIKSSGNVGIGTTSPGAKLQVVEPVGSSNGALRVGGASTYWELATQDDGGGSGAYLLYNRGNPNAFKIGYSGTSYANTDIQIGNFVGTGTAGISLLTQNTSRVYIQSTGNVGIGTTGPGAKLDVGGLGRFSSGIAGLPANGWLDLYGDSSLSTASVRIQSNGNVGIGTTAPGQLLQIGTAGTGSPGTGTLGVIRLTGSTSGYIDVSARAIAGSWTLNLPQGGGTNGYQLTTDGTSNTSWTAAGSLRSMKNITGLFGDPNDALATIVGTNVYRFHYKPEMGTGDTTTEYVGVMADEAPWAMHFNGTVVNPVNTLGYMVLGVQALNNKISALGVPELSNKVDSQQKQIDELKKEIEELKNK